MLKIDEYAYNACERNGTLESVELFEKRLDLLKHTHFFNRNEVYRWIYLGFEFCENMILTCKVQDIQKKIEMASKRGYKVAFSFPSMHQKQIGFFEEWVQCLAEQGMIEEWIVNDYGTFALLEKCGVHKGIVLGRMFEKAIREVRQNVLEIPEIQKHFEILQPEESIKQLRKLLGDKYQMEGAEIDTFPDGLLDLGDGDFNYHVHYPDIYLSSSPYCEYANGKREEKGRFILHQSCGRECCLYAQKISTTRGRAFYKIGNVMLCRQEKSLEECIKGHCRLVYSDRIHSKEE